MKFTLFFLFAFAFAHPSAAAEGATADAKTNGTSSSVVLSNGAVLSADISHPETGDTYIAENNSYTEVSLLGSASVELGVPDVAYIYVIDTSGSTAGVDGDCGTILECMQKFVFALHQEAISDGSASLAAVINFDYNVTVSADLQNISNSTGIEDAIFAGKASGENFCEDALNEAAKLVKDPRNTARTSVVIFVGDGYCSTCGKGCPIDDDYLLRDTDAIVYSVAVGPNVECVESLNDIPLRGGRCESVPDPDTLIDIVDKLIGSDLFKVEMRVDDGNYTEVPSFQLSGDELPAEAPALTNFNVTLDLAVGPHEVCIRATGDDSLGENDTVKECKRFVVSAPAAKKGGGALAATFLILSVFVGIGLAAFWHRRSRLATEIEDTANENAVEIPNNEHEVI